MHEDFIPIGEAEELLLAWYKWWEETDEAPVKMPEALHVKTAIYFSTETAIRSRERVAGLSIDQIIDRVRKGVAAQQAALDVLAQFNKEK